MAGGGCAVVGQRAHGELGQAPVNACPHLVGSDETDTLGQPGQTVRIGVVRPALSQRGVQERADRLRVGALRGVGADAAQRGIHREPADAPLAGRGAQYGTRGQPQVRQALAVRGGHGLGDLADHLVRVVHFERARGQERRQLRGVRKPLVHHIDEVVLLDRVQDLDEAGIAEKGGGPGRRQY